MSGPEVAAVVALDRKRGIGKGGELPWRLRGDMAHFRELTRRAPAGKRNAVVMGRKTFESIPAKFRPLPGRLNFVLSQNPSYAAEGATVVRSLGEAIERASADAEVADLFVIGGSSVYAAALQDPRCRTLYVTRVDAELDCDTFFPPFEERFECVQRGERQKEEGLDYVIERHVRR